MEKPFETNRDEIRMIVIEALMMFESMKNSSNDEKDQHTYIFKIMEKYEEYRKRHKEMMEYKKACASGEFKENLLKNERLLLEQLKINVESCLESLNAK